MKSILSLLALFAISVPTFAEETAIFAGGCFWCMEKPFDQVDGVSKTISGYIDGQTKNPTYRQVSSGSTGHTEAVEITYNPDKVSYEQLLEIFWRNIDPLDARGQFCDKGSQYRSGIYTLSDAQNNAAIASRDTLNNSGKLGSKIVTEIKPASTFYAAEDYHQNYYQVNPVRYKYYRWNCGRDQRLEELWGEKG